MENLLYLFLGWLAGLLSPAIVESIRRRREVVEVKTAIKTELDELRYRLASVAHFIESRYGEIDRSSLEWLIAICKEYRGPNPSEATLKFLEFQLALTDEEIAGLAERSKAPPDGALSLKKYVVPLMDSKIASLSWFNERLRSQLLQLNTHLNIFNEEVEQARYYFGLTYQSNISGANYDRVSNSLIGCYKNAASKARFIADLIGNIRWY